MLALTSPTLLSQIWERREFERLPSPKVGRRAGDEGDAGLIGILGKSHIA
jgi:hypothetical protein